MDINHIPKQTVLTTLELPEECRNRLLKVALSLVQNSVQDRSKAIEKIASDSELPIERVHNVLGVYVSIVCLFMEATEKEFSSKLLELGFSSQFIENLPLTSKRNEVVDTILSSRRSEFGRLEALKWRIDISLSNSLLNKKVPTSVILCLQLRDGRKVTVTVDHKMFHKLRFNVALIIRELTNSKALPKLPS